ncbi:MAG TPA: hypothetical protein VFQ72_01820 [Candidatus Paceibacterota bacterium]|nr:hypothetical protein [Candidatus Paceibacterota bacterium]
MDGVVTPIVEAQSAEPTVKALQVAAATRFLILDTNILSYLDNEKFGKQIIAFIKDLFDKSPGWGIAISNITIFEAVNELPVEKEEDMTETLAGVPSYEIDKETLILAAHLGSLYVDYFKDQGIQCKVPEAGDKIIAASAIKHNCFICTRNIQDYPAPFFIERIRKVFSYEKLGKGVNLQPMYILEPQIDTIMAYFAKMNGAKVDSRGQMAMQFLREKPKEIGSPKKGAAGPLADKKENPS